MSKFRFLLPLFFVIASITLPTTNAFSQCDASDAMGPCCSVAFGCGKSCSRVCVDVPLDSGITILLIAGFAFGVKRFMGRS
jgi:hypothetical protein